MKMMEVMIIITLYDVFGRVVHRFWVVHINHIHQWFKIKKMWILIFETMDLMIF